MRPEALTGGFSAPPTDAARAFRDWAFAERTLQDWSLA